MRWIVAPMVAPIVALIAAWGLKAEDPGSAVMGRWRSVATSKGGIGSIIQLKSGGSIEYSPGAVVEMKYRVEGNELVLPPSTLKGPELREKIEFTGPRALRLTSDGQPAMTFTRQGDAPDTAHSLLGEWTTPRDLNGKKLTAHYFFYPSGKALLLLPFLTKSGKYTIQGEKMKIDIPTLGASEGTFHRTGGTLILPLGKTGKVKYLSY